MNIPKQDLCVFLTFNGNAEEAMRFYENNLCGSKIESLVLFEKNADHGEEGKVLSGILSFKNQQIMFMDMEQNYPAPSFAWSTSLFVNCFSEHEFDLLFQLLSDNGKIMMGPESVMHIRKCAWVTDKFNVTWQLVWE